MHALERALEAVRDSGLTPLAGAEVVAIGWESTIVRVQTSSLDLAVRVYTFHDAATAERELRVMTGLSHAGYPVPRVHGLSINDRSQAALVMDFIEPSRTMTLSWSESTIDVLVDAMDRLHHSKLESWTDDPLGWAYVELDEISGTIQELRKVAKWVRQRLDHLDPIVGPVHLDFHPYNIVVDHESAFWVVDWTSFQVSDVRLDVHWTRLLWEMFGEPAHAAMFYDRVIDRRGVNINSDRPLFEVASALRRLAILDNMLSSNRDLPFDVGLQLQAAQVPIRWIHENTGLDIAPFTIRHARHRR